jgi:hypothetical protein
MRTFRACRSARERDKVPGPIHKGTMMNLGRQQPQDSQGRFLVPAGGHGRGNGKLKQPTRLFARSGQGRANVIVTINSKEPFG